MPTRQRGWETAGNAFGGLNCRCLSGTKIVKMGISQMTAEKHGRERRVNFQAWQCSFLLGLFLLIAVVPGANIRRNGCPRRGLCQGIVYLYPSINCI
jgi:hypothetical protein